MYGTRIISGQTTWWFFPKMPPEMKNRPPEIENRAEEKGKETPGPILTGSAGQAPS